MELLFKAKAHGVKVVGALGVFGKTGLLCLGSELNERGGALLLELFLAGQDVHGELLVVVEVFVVHLIQNGYVLHQRDLMALELLGDLVHVVVGLVVFGLERLNVVAGLFEEAQEALLVILGVKALELHHERADHVADLAQVLRAHGGQRGLREIRHVLLCACAVLQGKIGIGDVKLLCKLMHDLLLFRRQAVDIGAGLGRGLFLFFGLKLECGNGLQHGGFNGFFFCDAGNHLAILGFKAEFRDLVHENTSCIDELWLTFSSF